MLLRFRVGNFLSFKEVQTLRMRRKDSEGNETGSDLAFIFGPNASGKSNFIRAMKFAHDLIVRKLSTDVLPNYSHRDVNGCYYTEKPSYFEFVIRSFNGKEYSYGFEIDFLNQRIESEWLICLSDFPNGRKIIDNDFKEGISGEFLIEGHGTDGEPYAIEHCSDKSSILFGRFSNLDVEIDDVYQIIAFHTIVLSSNEYKPVTMVPDNFNQLLEKSLASFDTGIVHVVDRPVDQKMRDALEDYFTANVRDSQDEEYIHLNRSIIDDYDLYGYLEEDTHNSLYGTNTDIIFFNDYREHILKLIKRTYDTEEGYDYRELLFTHGSNHNATIEEESTGTVKIIHLLTLFISQLTGRRDTIVIDELECSIHASIMKECIRLFASDEVSGSQLIATTHETAIMDMDCLGIDSFWFVDTAVTELDYFSKLYALRSFKGKIIDYRNMYLDGRFDAIPSFFTLDLKEE